MSKKALLESHALHRKAARIARYNAVKKHRTKRALRLNALADVTNADGNDIPLPLNATFR